MVRHAIATRVTDRPGLLYLLFSAVPIEFQQRRQESAGISSLPFIAVFIGAFLGCCIVWAFVPRYNRKLHAANAISVPRERLVPMVRSSSLSCLTSPDDWRRDVPRGAVRGSLRVVENPSDRRSFSWTDVQYVSSPWPSIVFLGVIGGSILLLFLQAINWIVDTYLRSANSAIAANTMIRSLFGAGCAFRRRRRR